MTKFIIGTLIMILSSFSFANSIATERPVNWSCAQNVTGFAFDIQKMSGVWYEIMRTPPSDVPACVKVNASDKIENGTYKFQVDYRNNVNNKWTPTTEQYAFPWHTDTENGIFRLTYGNDEVHIEFIFKIVFTNYKSAAFICYYTSMAPDVNMFKVLTRTQEVDEGTKAIIEKFADEYEIGSQITWVDQSSRCNHAKNLQSFATLTLFLITLIFFG